MERLSYDELRKLALKKEIPDNKIAIGLWIKMNGYKRHHSVDAFGHQYYFYSLDDYNIKNPKSRK